MTALCEELLCHTLCDTIRICDCHRLWGLCCQVPSARQPPSSPASLTPRQTSAGWTYLRLCTYIGSEKSRSALRLYHSGCKPRTSRVCLRGKCRLSHAERGGKKRKKETFLTGERRRCLQRKEAELQSVLGEHKLSHAFWQAAAHIPPGQEHMSVRAGPPHP